MAPSSPLPLLPETVPQVEPRLRRSDQLPVCLPLRRIVLVRRHGGSRSHAPSSLSPEYSSSEQRTQPSLPPVSSLRARRLPTMDPSSRVPPSAVPHPGPLHLRRDHFLRHLRRRVVRAPSWRSRSRSHVPSSVNPPLTPQSSSLVQRTQSSLSHVP